MSSLAAIVPPEEPRAEEGRPPLAPVGTETGEPFSPAPPLFAPDAPAGRDELGREAVASLFADLCTHRDAGTPMLVGIHGGPGTGKSTLLRRIVERARDRDGTPAILTATVDAAGGGEPAAILTSRIFAALHGSFPALAEEAVYAGGDPVEAARAASERVNDLRRQLDAERQSLDELGGRRARLVDTVLFGTPGSRVDSYARQNRPRIEARLRAFGLPSGDPVPVYKDFVREAAETGGGASRAALALRALWGFKGQGTLLVLAVLLLIAGWGCAALADNQDAWAAWLQGFGDRFASLTAWAQDHAGWLTPLSHAALALAALAVLIDIARAIRFLQPVFRGASLLSGELDGRKRDLDAMLAHQTRRVDHLTADLDQAVRNAEIAERRVEARKSAGLLAPTLVRPGDEPPPPSTPQQRAQTFLEGLDAAMAGGALEAAATAPHRILVAIDGLDRLTPAAAAAWLETAHLLLGRANVVTVAAFDRAHMLNGLSETDPILAAARLRRCVQLSYDLDAEQEIAAVSGTAAEARLDRPWLPVEGRLVDSLREFAGPSPRARKSFVNRYRVARADPRLESAGPTDLASLALGLALADSGARLDLESAFDQEGVAGGDRGAADALAAARRASGERLSAADGRLGLSVARLYA